MSSATTDAVPSSGGDTVPAAATAATAAGTSSAAASSSSSSSGAPTVAAWVVDDAEPLTETMDDDDFLASLEAYEHRGTRSRSSVSEVYIPPPLAAKMAALKGGPPPHIEPPKSPEQKVKEAWEKGQKKG